MIYEVANGSNKMAIKITTLKLISFCRFLSFWCFPIFFGGAARRIMSRRRVIIALELIIILFHVVEFLYDLLLFFFFLDFL